MDVPHLMYISQKVKDIKVQANGLLEHKIASLRRWLQRHGFIPGDKFSAAMTPERIENGTLIADLSGKTLSKELEVHIKQEFPLCINDYAGPMDMEAIFSSVDGVQIDDGGNVQNMIVNAVIAAKCAHLQESLTKRKSALRITIASSSDPFSRLAPEAAETLRKECDVFILDIPDRFAIQVPWEEDERRGTLAISSEPRRTGDALQTLIGRDRKFKKAFERANCFVSSDPIYNELGLHAKPPYTYIVNASTAFRSLVAADSYSRTVVLPMNNEEAGDVCKLLLQRGLEEELDKVERPPFNSPLTTSGEEIDHEALRELDRSVDMLATYIPFHRNRDRMSFACPISFGADGGLLVGVGRETMVCFTSTPLVEKEDALLDEFGDATRMSLDRRYEVGAGDSVATIITLFNAIDPIVFIAGHLSGRENDDSLLGELASTIFVSVLGRIAGNFLTRTNLTHWANINEDAFPRLIDEVAQESLTMARKMVRKLHAPVIGEIARWGINVVMWKPGRVAYPNREF